MDLSRLAALLAFSGAVLVPVSPARAACEVTVSSNNFTPPTKTVAPGATVEWCWTEGTHTVNFADGPKSGVMTAGGKYSRTFDTAGTFDYVCDFHEPSMAGTVTVAAPSSSPSPSKSPTTRPTTRPPTAPPTTRAATTPPPTRIPTPTTTPTTAAPTTAAPSEPATTAPATPSTTRAALDIDPAPAKPNTGLAIAIGLVVAAAALGTAGWLLLRGRSG